MERSLGTIAGADDAVESRSREGAVVMRRNIVFQWPKLMKGGVTFLKMGSGGIFAFGKEDPNDSASIRLLRIAKSRHQTFLGDGLNAADGKYPNIMTMSRWKRFVDMRTSRRVLDEGHVVVVAIFACDSQRFPFEGQFHHNFPGRIV